MRSHRVLSIDGYREPGGRGWVGVKGEEVVMMATPLAMQPTEYVRKSWEGKVYGEVKGVRVSSVHDGQTWAVKATWSGGALGGTDFPDAFAVAMPVKGKPALALMGSVDAPIYILRWQANKEGVQLVSATGIGQSAPGAQIKAGVQVRKVGDEWSVVITRALGAGQGVAPLQAGKKTQIGFAVWNGGNDERAGIKAFSIDWAELVLDA